MNVRLVAVVHAAAKTLGAELGMGTAALPSPVDYPLTSGALLATAACAVRELVGPRQLALLLRTHLDAVMGELSPTERAWVLREARAIELERAHASGAFAPANDNARPL